VLVFVIGAGIGEPEDMRALPAAVMPAGATRFAIERGLKLPYLGFRRVPQGAQRHQGDPFAAIALGHQEVETGREQTALHGFNRGMEKAVAYLISVGIVGFGVWSIFASMAGSSGSGPMWVAGSVPVVVGLLSLSDEIHNTL
jgi:hypothetical protein